MKKKFIAIVALCAMALSLVPFSAFAATGDDIDIRVIEFNNNMDRDVLVNIEGTGLDNGMNVYWRVDDSTSPELLGTITNAGGENNFYIDKSLIPNIEDPFTSSKITISITNAGFTDFVKSVTATKEVAATDPQQVVVAINDGDGTTNRSFTIKFDENYVPKSGDRIVFQALDEDGDEVGSAQYCNINLADLSSDVGTDGLRARKNGYAANSFNSAAESVRVSFQRDGKTVDTFTTELPLASQYGTFSDLELVFNGGTSVARGEEATGTLYYVNTEGNRYDITDKVSFYYVIDSAGSCEEAGKVLTEPVLNIKEDAEVGAKISITTSYNGHLKIVDLTVVDDLTPAKASVSAGGHEPGKTQALTFQLLDEDGENATLGFQPDDIQINWIDSSSDTAQLSNITHDYGVNLASKGTILVNLQMNESATGKFELIFKDDEGHSARYVTDAFTFEETTSADTKEVIFTIGSKIMQVDGKDITIDAPAIISQNRTYVPLRAGLEAFGATVLWQPDGSVTIDRGEDHLVMNIGSIYYTLNDKQGKMDVAPYLVADANRVMVPFRFVGEALGYDVDITKNSDGTTKTVIFTAK